MRNGGRLLSGLTLLLGPALCLLLAACTGGSVQISDLPGSVTVSPSDEPPVRVQPTWNVPLPTALPTPTPTPIA